MSSVLCKVRATFLGDRAQTPDVLSRMLSERMRQRFGSRPNPAIANCLIPKSCSCSFAWKQLTLGLNTQKKQACLIYPSRQTPVLQILTTNLHLHPASPIPEENLLLPLAAVFIFFKCLIKKTGLASTSKNKYES